MATSMNIRLEIQCPNCYQASVVDPARIPKKAVQVTCHRCQNKFQMDQSSQLNCKLRNPNPKASRQTLTFDANVMEWMVNHKFCNGMRYDVKGLATLIRSGMITKKTMIRPPGSTKAFPAGMLVQLRRFFEKEKEVDLDATLEGEVSESSDDPKAWYEMDCGDFFENKLKPLLTKDLMAGKKTG